MIRRLWESLAIRYTDRRQQRNQLQDNDYQTTLRNIKEGFSNYVGVTNAGLNGAREYGFHLLTVSEGILDGGVSAPPELVVDNPNLSIDTVTHEYTHVVQSALLFNKEFFACQTTVIARVGGRYFLLRVPRFITVNTFRAK